MKPPAYNQLSLELDKLKACIHCGMCLPACPTYRATGSEAESPRGRLYLMRELLEGSITADQAEPHLDQCLACHGCETVCPSGVRYGDILLGTREDLARRDHSLAHRFKRLLLRHLLPNRAWLHALGALGRLYQRSFLKPLAHGLGIFKLIPALGRPEALLPSLPDIKRLHPGMSFGNPSGEHVVLLIGCVMDVLYNPVHWDTITVLVANGYHVSIPDQTCCGALAHHSGDTDITRDLARRNVQQMLARHPDWVVVNSAGCGSTMKEYDRLLAEDPVYGPKARLFADKVVDITELLARKPLAPFRRPLPLTVTYHAACHLHHVQRVQQAPIALLSQIPELTLIPLTQADACCGSAGVYNVEHPQLSQEILAMKTEHLKDAHHQGATAVATGNPGCMLQLETGLQEAGLPMSVRHPISILAEAYR